MSMFEHFPYTNLHELNLDWIIEQIKNLGNTAVLSVNGETGDVILYQDENITFPPVDSPTWRMVRSSNGTTVGVMFQNGLMYVMNGNQASRVYTIDDPPAYPVTSVNGQTGAVTLYPDAGVRLPDVDDNYTNIRRQIDSAGTPAIVGIQVDKTKAQRLNGTNRVDIYDAENQPPYPVTSVDGHTGAVETWAYSSDTVLKTPVESESQQWGLTRDTVNGELGIKFVENNGTYEGYITYTPDGGTEQTLKILTPNDIPSASGVISINSLTGVVTLTGSNIRANSNTNDTIADILLNHDVIINALQQSTAVIWDEYTNYAKGDLVIYNKYLYIATTDNPADLFENQNWSNTEMGSELAQTNRQLGALTFIMEDITIHEGETKQYTLEQETLQFVCTSGTNNTRFGLWYVFSRSTGNVVVLEIAKGSGVSLTSDTSNHVLIENTGTGTIKFGRMILWHG